MTPSKRLGNLVNRFYEDYFGFNPTLGREAGFHKYLGEVPDLAYENIIGFLKRLQFYEIEVERLQKEELSVPEQADIAQLNLTIYYEKFVIQQLRWWANDPLAYGKHLDVSHYLKRNYASPEIRAQHTIRHLAQIPQLLEQQRFNLELVQPRINLATAIEMYKGYHDFFTKDVIRDFKALVNTSLVQQLEEVVTEVEKSLDSFIFYMENDLLPKTTEDFAIGRFNFLDMLRYGEMVEMELDEVLRIGEADLEKNKRRFKEIAEHFMPNKSSRDVMLEIAKDHPTSESLIDSTRDMLEDIRQFIINRNLVTVPSDVRIQVEETPRFMRWAFAMCDTPGPFEKKATESFYYVTNVLPDWSEDKKEEWLRKFDFATLDNVSIHEAYPGHYIHYLHTLSVPSTVAKIAGAYSFLEGWAHYVEEMMLEEGWHKGDPKYRLAQLSEALLRDCRYICSIKMHTQGMTVDEATEFFMENAYMEKTPARKEADRGTYDPGYLNYTLGKLMILKLREDWRKQEGDNYSLKRFHDTLLLFGAPPIPLVRKLMLKNDDREILWEK